MTVVQGTSAELVAMPRGEGTAPRRSIVLRRPTDRALVLGSTQPASAADGDAIEERGVAVARRRSGGGAVFVAPGAQAWVDCFLPAGDALLDPDVGRSFAWLGRLWATTLAETWPSPTPVLSIASRPELPNEWSRLVCFAGTGAGEVLADGRKVVGLASRRDRAGAWFHCLVPVVDSTTELLACLAIAPQRRAKAEEFLRLRARPAAVDVEALERAFLRAVADLG